MKSISLPKMAMFIIVLIGLSVLYYKKVLSVNNDGNKLLKGFKHLFAVLVLLGLLSLFSTIKSVTGQFVLLVFIAFMINIYNINHSINKCNFPTLYKVNLFGRSSAIILFVAVLIYYSYQGNFFRFLYSDVELDSGTKQYTVSELNTKLKLNLKKRDEMPSYCPNMNKNDYKDDPTSDDNKQWSELSSEKRNNCLASHSSINERKDISDKIYA